MVRLMTEHETAHKRYMNTNQTSMSVHLYHASSQLLFSFSKVTHTKQDFCLLLSFLSASDSFSTEPTPPRVRKVCNESRLQWEVEVCGEGFKEDMTHIDPQNWCNLTHFIRYHRIWRLLAGCRRSQFTVRATNKWNRDICSPNFILYKSRLRLNKLTLTHLKSSNIETLYLQLDHTVRGQNL